MTIAAILIEIAISRTISHRLKQKLLGYEPETFSSMFTIRDNILESIHDGVLSVDSENQVQFVNAVAEKIRGDDEKSQADMKKISSPKNSSHGF